MKRNAIVLPQLFLRIGFIIVLAFLTGRMPIEPVSAQTQAGSSALTANREGRYSQWSLLPFPPTGIFMDPSSIAENTPPGSRVIQLHTVDPNAGDTFQYSLVPGPSGQDNGSFYIDQDYLIARVELNFEVKSSYKVLIRSTDQTGRSIEHDVPLNIYVTDEKEAPKKITLSNASVNENQPAGSMVGALSSENDVGETVQYALTACAGPHNSLFELVGDTLFTNATFDAETTPVLSICVRATDSNGVSADQVLSIKINSIATAAHITPGWMRSETHAGSRIGILSCNDLDIGDTIIYELAPVPENSDFEIRNNNELYAVAPLSQAPGSSYTLYLNVKDGKSSVMLPLTMPVIRAYEIFQPVIIR